MRRTLYVGDVHGKVDVLKKIVSATDHDEDSVIIQVGDFGFGFPGEGITRWLEERAKLKFKTPIYTCMGNHDNWDLLYEMRKEQGNPDLVELFPESNCFYVHRGSMIDIFGVSHLFFGGAESTDQTWRIEGATWWAKEQANKEEFDKFLDVFENEKPNTIITHDAPLRVKLDRVGRNKSITPVSLESVYKMSSHRPRYHMFGHHHALKRWKINKTKFYCCGLHGEGWVRESGSRASLSEL